MKLVRDPTIRQRLLIASLLPATLIAVLVSGFLIHDSTTTLARSVQDRGLAIVSFLAPASEYGLISGNRENLDALLQATVHQGQVHAAAIVDRQGRTLAISGATKPPPRSVLSAVDRPLSLPRTASGTPPGFAAPVVRSSVDLGDMIEPGSAAHDVLGWVYAEIDDAALKQRSMLVVASDVGLILLSLIGAGALALRMANAVSRPVSALASAVGAMALGRHDTRVATGSGGEIGALEAGFNDMAGALEAVHRDMQSRIDEATAQLRHLADHDPLSGLPNRRAFERETQAAIRTGCSEGHAHALCLIDLDRFKAVNDVCGHAAGDELLRRVAGVMRQRIRDRDMVARVGGDEFAVLLRNCPLEDARQIAENLREAVAAFRFRWDGREFAVGASIGLVALADPDCELAAALAAADRACFEAKRCGRNLVREQSVAGSGSTRDEGQDAVTLAGALADSRLQLFAHPLQAADGSTTAWAEILLRLDDGARGSGEDFIERCERCGDGLALDLWVLRTVCQRLAAVAHRPPRTLRVSLNLSSAALLGGGRDYAAEVAATLQRWDLPAEVLGFELAADRVAQYPGEAAALASRLREAGSRVVLDGVRDHAPAIFRMLRPDYLKIRLDELCAEYPAGQAAAIATAQGSIAAALGIGLIAGGIERGDALPPALAALAAFRQGEHPAPERPLDAWLLQSEGGPG